MTSPTPLPHDSADYAVSVLQQSPATLNDLACARIRSSLLERVNTPQEVKSPTRWLNRVALVGALSAAAAICFVLLYSFSDDSIQPKDQTMQVVQPSPDVSERPEHSNLQGQTQLASGALIQVAPGSDVDVLIGQSTAIVRSGQITIASNGLNSVTRLQVGTIHIEVANAVFSAAVDAKSLQIRVEHGVVPVRFPDGQTILVPAPTSQRFARPSQPTSSPISKLVPVLPAPTRPRPDSKSVVPAKPPTADKSQGATLPTPVTPQELYAQADTMIAAGRPSSGITTLKQLIDLFPNDPRVKLARYDLARLSHRAGKHAEAKSHLRVILKEHKTSVVTEPSQYLLCRIYFETQDSKALACTRDYGRFYPKSARSAELLAYLASLRLRQEGCVGAVDLCREYVSDHPKGVFAKQALRIISDCQGSPSTK